MNGKFTTLNAQQTSKKIDDIISSTKSRKELIYYAAMLLPRNIFRNFIWNT